MRKAVLILLVLSLLLTMPGLFHRFQVEWNNRNYETIVEYQDLENLVSEDVSIHIEAVLQRLKESGLHAVSLQPETLKSLEKKGQIIVLTGEKIKEMSIFNKELEDIAGRVSNEGTYVYIQEKNELTSRLTTIFPSIETESVTILGREFLYISDLDTKKYNEYPIGFMEEAIEQIKRNDLSVVFRIPNTFKKEDHYVFNQLIKLSDGKSNSLLFTGNEVIGYPNAEQIISFAEKLNSQDIVFYSIEFAEQLGQGTLANAMNMNTIRLHSLNLNKVSSLEEGVERAVRAVKERNIRSLFIRMKVGIEPEKALQNTELFLQKLNNKMPDHYIAGKAQGFDQISIPVWSSMFALLSANLFIAIAVLEVFKKRALFFLSLAVTFMIGFGALILNIHILVQFLALIAAVVTSIFAIFPITKARNFIGILKIYGRSIIISCFGIIIVVSLLNGNEYLVKLEEFRGVKLTYIVPILFVMIYAFIGDIKGLFNMKVRYWHLAIIGLVGIIGFYYISRTGNTGSVSSIELNIRQWLEQTLYVRPRTKEFLIGFPFYILALFVYPIYKKLGTYLLIPGVIGYLSIVNTFTHLHIPLFISMLRTMYSLGIGLVIGMIFILLFKKGRFLYEEKIKPRWYI